MADINDGGSAFPITREEWDSDSDRWRVESSGGMSLRDYFAAKAMPGLMGRDWRHHKGTDLELIEVWARSSYAVADAMLKAREA